MSFVHIVVLAGGVGGARFLAGLRAAAPGARLTAVVNTGDDVTMHGLRICPDLDTVMYTLGGGIDTERGWGRAGESWTVKEELAAYGAEPTWFGLGDRDLATHLVRTRMLDAGYPLSQVTAALADRWQPGVELLPMSDQRVETHVVVADPDTGRQQAVHFQEWWVRHRAEPEARAFVQVGVDAARPAPGVANSASRSPGTPRIVPIDTTGFEGASSTASAAAKASATPGAGFAASTPTCTNARGSGSARCRTHHSWKWIACSRPVSGSATTTWVSTRWSVIGSSSTPGCQRSASAAVTWDSG